MSDNRFPDEHPVNFLTHCPHCGSPRFVPQGSKELLCSDCGFDFFPNSACAVVALITDCHGRIMLTRRARNPWKGMLDLPGGFVDPGEGAETALQREVMEELGLTLLDARYLCSFPNRYVYSGYMVHTTDLAFVCSVDNMDKLRVMDDISAVEWYDVDSLPVDDIPAESIRNILLCYKQKL